MAKNGKAKFKSADARKNASFSSCGGSSDPTNGVGVKTGIGGGGGKAYHAAPKSKANISPGSARDHAGFDGVGGSPKSGNEY
jgi:hypothetical protein